MRYRLSTVFVAMTVIAAGLLMWRRFVAPAIEGISLEAGRVVVRLTDDYSQSMLESNPALREAAGEYGGGDLLVHDAYVSFPIAGLLVVVGIVAVLACFVGLVFVRAATWLTRRRKAEE
jgi:hypothetical protein